MQKSLLLLKPDTVSRNNMWEVIKRLERKWLKIVWMKIMQLDKKILEEHYYHVVNEDFFPRIVRNMTKYPVIAIAASWKDSIKLIRSMIWLTNPAEAAPWSTRGDLWNSFNTTVIHASDSIKNAERELKIFFDDNEIFEYSKFNEKVL